MKLTIPGAGSSRVAKKEQNTAAVRAATAPSGQAKPIQMPQQTRVAMPAAAPDSRARRTSLCSGRSARGAADPARRAGNRVAPWWKARRSSRQSW